MSKEHLCLILNKEGKIKLNIIQCYTPANDKDKKPKEDFYSTLQTLCAKLKALGTMNENSDMLADFCTFNNTFIGGSVFPHRRVHKATCVSPDHRTGHQIEHLGLINSI